MAQCQTIKLRQHPEKKSTASRRKLILTSDIGTIIGQDVSDAVVQMTACEIDMQEKYHDNPATHLIVNNKPGVSIREVDPGGAYRRGGQLVYRTKAIFGQIADMIPAANEALKQLIALTRVRSGKAIQSYRIYLGNTALTGDPGKLIGYGGAAIKQLDGLISSNSTITILGPYLVYGRKLYWNTTNEKQIRKRFRGARNASRVGVTIRGGYKGSRMLHVEVKKKMRRSARWAALTISDPWFEPADSPMVIGGKNNSKNKRVPSITISPKKAGRLN